MRALRVTSAQQLVLHFDGVDTVTDQWEQLPDETRGQVLVLLARMIARGVIDGIDAGGEADHE